MVKATKLTKQELGEFFIFLKGVNKKSSHRWMAAFYNENSF
jgi:hypothetical protein